MCNIYLLAKEGNEEAMMEVLNRFEGLIVKNCSKYKLKGLETDDLKQICYIAVIEAINKIREEQIDTAPAYIITTIRNALNYETRKNLKNPDVSSLNEITESGTEYLDLLESDEDIEMAVLEKIDKENILKALDTLTTEEKDVLSHFVLNSYGGLKDYSEKYHVDYRRVRYIKDKAIQKLKAFTEV